MTALIVLGSLLPLVTLPFWAPSLWRTDSLHTLTFLAVHFLTSFGEVFFYANPSVGRIAAIVTFALLVLVVIRQVNARRRSVSLDERAEIAVHSLAEHWEKMESPSYRHESALDLALGIKITTLVVHAVVLRVLWLTP